MKDNYAFDNDMMVQKVMGRYAMVMTEDGMLGEGAFSVCRKGIDPETGEAVAIKMYKVQKGGNGSAAVTLKKFKRQVAVLQKIQEPFAEVDQPELWHPHLHGQKPSKFFVRLLDYSRDAFGCAGPDPLDGTLYVVTEMADHSLKDYLRAQRAHGQLPRDAVRRLSRSVVMAAAALHAKGYVHLDLKPENIMFFSGRLKIIDLDGCVKLGTAVSMQDSSSSFSPFYCAPEWARFLQGERAEITAGPELDAWSVGLILCELATLSAVMRPAFHHFYKRANSAGAANVAYIDWLGSLETPPMPHYIHQFDPELGDFLLSGILECDPDVRLTPAECLSSSYLYSA
jgi:serine/threonine protein kinase